MLTTASLVRASLCLAVVLTPTVVGSRPMVASFYLPKVIVVLVVGTAIAVLAAVHLPDRWAAADRPVRATMLASAAFVVWLLVATVTSDQPRLSLLGQDSRFVGTVVAVLPAALVLAVPVGADTRRRLAIGGLLVGFVLGMLAAYSVLQYLGMDPRSASVSSGSRPVATFGNSNFVGAVLCLAVPLGLWMWVQDRQRRYWAVALLGVVGVALWVAQARLGWIAAAAGVIAFLVAMVDHRWRTLQGWVVAVLPVAAPLVGLLAVAVGIAIGDRTGLARLGYWRAAAPMWADNPVTGVGVGRFGAFHRFYRPPAAVLEGRFDISVDSSHAWLLDLAATTGTLGPLLWLAVLAGVGGVLRAAWLHRPADQRPLIAGLLGMITAHGVQSSIAVPMVVQVWFGWLLVGAVLALALSRDEPSPSTGPDDGLERRRPRVAVRTDRTTLVTVGVAIVATSLVAVQGLALWTSARDVGRAPTLRVTQGDDVALERLDAAAERTPWWPDPSRQLVSMAVDAERFDVARAAMPRAAAADPRSRPTMLVLRDASIAMDGDAAARPWIDHLRRLDPVGLDLHLSTAAWALQVGDTALAEESLDVVARIVGPDNRHWPRYRQLRDELVAASPP